MLLTRQQAAAMPLAEVAKALATHTTTGPSPLLVPLSPVDVYGFCVCVCVCVCMCVCV